MTIRLSPQQTIVLNDAASYECLTFRAENENIFGNEKRTAKSLEKMGLLRMQLSVFADGVTPSQEFYITPRGKEIHATLSNIPKVVVTESDLKFLRELSITPLKYDDMSSWQKRKSAHTRDKLLIEHNGVGLFCLSSAGRKALESAS